MTTEKKQTTGVTNDTPTKATPTKRKKYGGRTKGTPNKVTQLGRDTINSLLSSYSSSGLMSQDFLALEPKDRLTIADRLMSYVLPKFQSIALDVTSSSSSEKSIEDRLKELSQ